MNCFFRPPEERMVKMKAVIWTGYGGPQVLVPSEIGTPVPRENEILLKIHSASVTAGDCEMRRLELPLGLSLPVRLYAGWSKPRRIQIPGQEFSGEVVKTGARVSKFVVGDLLCGTTGFRFGAYAEYICVSESPDEMSGVMAVIPENLSMEEASALPTAGMEALHYLKESKLEKGHKLLIIGAGGSIGSFALQAARHMGIRVTAVDSGDKLQMLSDLGAERVIDYASDEFPGSAGEFDSAIDVVGGRGVLKRLGYVRPGGSYFLAFAYIRHLLLAPLIRLLLGKKLNITSSSQSPEELQRLIDFTGTARISPVIHKSFPLAAAAEAHRFAESGVKQGNIVLTAQT